MLIPAGVWRSKNHRETMTRLAITGLMDVLSTRNQSSTKKREHKTSPTLFGSQLEASGCRPILFCFAFCFLFSFFKITIVHVLGVLPIRSRSFLLGRFGSFQTSGALTWTQNSRALVILRAATRRTPPLHRNSQR